ncbi:hypothetical protein D3C77_724510 [compost metagenome]
MHRAGLVAGGQHLGDLLWGHRAQRVEAQPQLLRWLAGQYRAELLLQLEVLFGAIDEAALAFVRGLAAKAGVAIQYW